MLLGASQNESNGSILAVSSIVSNRAPSANISGLLGSLKALGSRLAALLIIYFNEFRNLSKIASLPVRPGRLRNSLLESDAGDKAEDIARLFLRKTKIFPEEI